MVPIIYPSPNYNERCAPVDMLIVHYTGMMSKHEALERLCSPEYSVSSHYLIDEEGLVYSLVSEEKRAWHAGKSYWDGRTDINSHSIGIELVNPGHEWGYRAFPLQQIQSLVILIQDIRTRYIIPNAYVLGHSDVAPMRKRDPGELFPWEYLARYNIGLWPNIKPTSRVMNCLTVQRLLCSYGYSCSKSGLFDMGTRACIRAFQRHFMPQKVGSLCLHSIGGMLDSLMALKPI